MIRIIYKWRVQEADETKFRAAWAKATTAIREITHGARGSFLLHSHENPTEFVTVARWDTLENWQAFWKDSTRMEMQTMHSLAERISVEVYEELEDHTV
ncbi:MAG: antibiotic biosynthesis monooxygenase [Chloroflexota bacterium]